MKRTPLIPDLKLLWTGCLNDALMMGNTNRSVTGEDTCIDVLFVMLSAWDQEKHLGL